MAVSRRYWQRTACSRRLFPSISLEMISQKKDSGFVLPIHPPLLPTQCDELAALADGFDEIKRILSFSGRKPEYFTQVKRSLKSDIGSFNSSKSIKTASRSVCCRRRANPAREFSLKREAVVERPLACVALEFLLSNLFCGAFFIGNKASNRCFY